MQLVVGLGRREQPQLLLGRVGDEDRGSGAWAALEGRRHRAVGGDVGRVDDVEVVELATQDRAAASPAAAASLRARTAGAALDAIGEQRPAAAQVRPLRRSSSVSLADLDEGAQRRRVGVGDGTRQDLARVRRLAHPDSISQIGSTRECGSSSSATWSAAPGGAACARRCRSCASATRPTWSIVNGENSAGGMGITEKHRQRPLRRRRRRDHHRQPRLPPPRGLRLPRPRASGWCGRPTTRRPTPAAATPWSRRAGCGSR